MRFSLDNILVLIGRFHCLGCSLDNLIKNVGESDFKHLNQKLDNRLLDLVKQKGFYSYEYMCDFEKMMSKNKFYSSLSGRGVNGKNYEHVLKFWDKFVLKTMENYCNLSLKCDALLLADVFEKFRNTYLENYGFRA